ncbi:MAG: ABC transporter ATP-binding protein [Propionibacteriaceae bacterium]|nr:ABC transporter ATP-binding protein [Propionibacteriaceae bacterium]
MALLTVEGLNKSYPAFSLKDVSFSLEPGYIMGFVGRNGSGKTTTLKAIMNLIHPQSGTITILGQDFRTHELDLKERIGFGLGDVPFYPKRTLAAITAVVARFYTTWDAGLYARLVRQFGLDVTKKVDQLSAGMKVKYSLALAMSHHAQLLILDEPTSGLDPVSRDDLLYMFRSIIESGEASILFSTHITSDLEKCADFITYIRDGSIVASRDKDSFVDAYRLVKGPKSALTPNLRATLIGCRETSLGFTGLALTQDLPPSLPGIIVETPDIESVMVYHEMTTEEPFVYTPISD